MSFEISGMCNLNHILKIWLCMGIIVPWSLLRLFFSATVVELDCWLFGWSNCLILLVFISTWMRIWTVDSSAVFSWGFHFRLSYWNFIMYFKKILTETWHDLNLQTSPFFSRYASYVLMCISRFESLSIFGLPCCLPFVFLFRKIFCPAPAVLLSSVL